MRLFGRKTTAKPGAVINGEYVADAVEPTRSSRVLRFILRVLLVILALILIYLAYLFVKDLFSNNDQSTSSKPGTSQGQVNAPGQSSTNTPSSGIQVGTGGSSQQLTNNTGSANKTGTSTGSSSGTANNSSNSNSQDLAKSGPEHVLGVFVLASLGGTVGYHVLLRRKLTSAE